jgi:hypothetical protein
MANIQRSALFTYSLSDYFLFYVFIFYSLTGYLSVYYLISNLRLRSYQEGEGVKFQLSGFQAVFFFSVTWSQARSLAISR